MSSDPNVQACDGAYSVLENTREWPPRRKAGPQQVWMVHCISQQVPAEPSESLAGHALRAALTSRSLSRRVPAPVTRSSWAASCSPRNRPGRTDTGLPSPWAPRDNCPAQARDSCLHLLPPWPGQCCFRNKLSSPNGLRQAPGTGQPSVL